MKKMHSKVWLLVVMILVASTACKGKATKLTLEKDTFSPGEMVKVTYVALPEYDSRAWIGIIPSGIKHGSETLNDQHDVAYKYLNKSTSGEINFAAPVNPGSYDIRMNDTDNNGVEVAYVTFTVVGEVPKTAPTPAPVPSQEVSKFGVGDAVMVEWKGRWWPAHVISLRKGDSPYKIHYKGYSSSWDEWVGNARIGKR